MITEKKAANAMGGNTARACDSCLVKRARWFCGADDAFLCQRCDASVHSANQLASRHERVRLQTSSLKLVNDSDQSPVPAWHQGFTRKARTPRHNKPNMMQAHAKDDEQKVLQPLPFVPEIGSEEANSLEDEYENEDLEQLLYRVPIFDPFAAELCNNLSNEVGNSGGIDDDEATHEMRMGNHEVHDGSTTSACELDNLQGFLPSDMELAEFAADVENLLGRGLDEDSSDLKGLGLLDCKEENHDINGDVCVNDNIEDCRKIVKVEEELEAMELAGVGDQSQFNPTILDWNFDYDESSAALLVGDEEEEEEEEEKVVLMGGTTESSDDHTQMMKRKIFLRLNYEAVITEWASQGSPWTTGIRPELNPEDGWPDCMGMWGTEMDRQAHGDGAGWVGGHGIRGDDRGREARVSRYREKRRTRLFSKKIRYEVRKLNAEKRPRMKGRFVKRSTMSTSSFVGVQGMMITSNSTTLNGSMNAFPYPLSAGSNNK